MDIFEADKLTLFIAFVIPGFVSLKTYELICPSISRSASEQIVEAIAYSCISYAILFLPIKWIEENDIIHSNPLIYYLFYLFCMLIFPALLSLLWKKVRTSKKFLANAPHPIQRPWDFLFQQRKPYWISISLTNGTVIAGRFSGKSFASSSPAEEQIYLEEVWITNSEGKYERPVKRSAGAIVFGRNISHITLKEYE